jgi:hypothetical protein
MSTPTRRRRPAPDTEIFIGSPGGVAPRQPDPAEVFADPDRAKEQDALVQAGRREDETYTAAFDRLRAEAFAAREETTR